LVAVFFGAEKAQAWLMHNHWQLRAPIRAQLGATINFEAGTVRRAPPLLRSTGFEWLWRIKEEPYLWRRYWSDGKMLLRLLFTSVLPLMVSARRKRARQAFSIRRSENQRGVTIFLSGAAVAAHVDESVDVFRRSLDSEKQVTIDLADTTYVDSRFLGLLLMVLKQSALRGQDIIVTQVSSSLRRIFRLNKFDFLLPEET
jgi:N-acetylglucosaminyldiphosphoundecaprenol N-acetyl-beta-D-mannosaminyltransferase